MYVVSHDYLWFLWFVWYHLNFYLSFALKRNLLSHKILDFIAVVFLFDVYLHSDRWSSSLYFLWLYWCSSFGFIFIWILSIWGMLHSEGLNYFTASLYLIFWIFDQHICFLHRSALIATLSFSIVARSADLL